MLLNWLSNGKSKAYQVSILIYNYCQVQNDDLFAWCKQRRVKGFTSWDPGENGFFFFLQVNGRGRKKQWPRIKYTFCSNHWLQIDPPSQIHLIVRNIIAQIEHEYISWYKYCFEDIKLIIGIFFPVSIHFIKQTLCL